MVVRCYVPIETGGTSPIDRAVLDAYGWSDLAPLVEIGNGNVAPSSVVSRHPRAAGEGKGPVVLKGNPQGEPQTGGSGFSPTSMTGASMAPTLPVTRDEAKRLLDEALLDRLVALNAERAALTVTNGRGTPSFPSVGGVARQVVFTIRSRLV